MSSPLSVRILPHHIREAKTAKCLDDSEVFEGSGCFVKCEVAVLAQTIDLTQFWIHFPQRLLGCVNV